MLYCLKIISYIKKSKVSEKIFSIVIPSYNRLFLLEIIIPELLKQINDLNIQGELLVIDDGSTDNTPNFLLKIQNDNSNFRFIINPKNLGIAKTRNLLIKNANGKFIIFCDSDVIPSSNWLKSHLDTLMCNEKVISQGKLILTNQITNLKEVKNNPLTDNSRAFFDTANVGILRNTLLNMECFDEGFLNYGWEDLELGLRLKKQKIKLVRNNNALGYHYQNTLLKDLDSLKQKELGRVKGTIYFYNKHRSLEVGLMTQIYTINYWLDKLSSKILGLDKKDFFKRLEILEKSSYNRFIPLLRAYLNHFYVVELHKDLNKNTKKFN